MSIGFCQDYIRIARLLIEGASLENIPEIAAKKGISQDSIESTGFVLHTFHAALWCLANTSSYKECVLAAVNLGSDTDTTAAVAGALAGIAYGYGAIPAEWIECLRGKYIIESVLF